MKLSIVVECDYFGRL